jgi:tissue factor pathway inhibitor
MYKFKHASVVIPMLCALAITISTVMLFQSFKYDLGNLQSQNIADAFTPECPPWNITVTSPIPEEMVKFPLTVKATVDNREHPKCLWGVFEANAGQAKIVDQYGEMVGTANLQAQGEWMTAGPIAITAKITAKRAPAAGRLRLILTDDDPSGTRDLRSVEIPLVYKTRCAMRPDPGFCRAAFPKYTFNEETKKCEKFIYGGCGGNVPFNSQSDCEAACE